MTLFDPKNLETQLLEQAQLKILELEAKQAFLEHKLEFEQHILKHMTEGVTLVRMVDGIIVYTNPAFDKMLGYEPGELIGEHYRILRANADYDFERQSKIITSEIANNGHWQGEIKNKKKSGECIWVKLTINSFLHSEYGAVWIAVRQDVTKKKEMEESLLQKEMQFQHLINASPTPYALIDDSGNVKYLNPAFIKTFGYDRNDIPRIEDWRKKAYVTDEYRGTIKKIWESHVATFDDNKDEFKPIELRVRCKNGEERTVINSISSFSDNSENLHLGTFFDITERKYHETELIKLHQELQQLQYTLDNVGIGVQMVEFDGSFSYVNQAFANLTGYTRTELLDMKVWQVDENFREGSFEESTELFRKNKYINRIESSLVKKNGQKFPVEITFRSIQSENGQDGRFISFIVDLTEKKQSQLKTEKLQLQLNQAQKMKTIGQLTGGIAHDFNNILTPIIGYTELAKNLTLKESKNITKNLAYLDEISRAGLRAKELISQLLAFSRGSVSDQATPAKRIIIKPVIEEVVTLLRSSFPSTIDLSLQFDDETLSSVIEPIHLHQIVMNLCINARDAIRQYGRIKIQVGRSKRDSQCLSCDQDFTGDYVYISVKDNGSGIDKQHLARIFEPFFSTKGVGAGSGMGLSVVHGLVHSAGGHITINSKETRGTTFYVLLPFADSVDVGQSNGEVAVLNDDVSLNNVRILVVDDEPAITTMLNVLLRMHNAAVTSFNDATEALNYFTHNHQNIDLVISDQTMPKLSGLDMARQMLQIKEKLPIIICSGNTEHLSRELSEKSGITCFMSKPIDFNSLLERVSEFSKPDNIVSNVCN